MKVESLIFGIIAVFCVIAAVVYGPRLTSFGYSDRLLLPPSDPGGMPTNFASGGSGRLGSVWLNLAILGVLSAQAATATESTSQRIFVGIIGVGD